MSADHDTIPAPPSWVPSRVARQWTAVLLAAVLGTSGCGGLVAGAANLIQAVNAGNARVAERLTVIEGKLDSVRDELAEVKAQGGENRERIRDLGSNVAGVEDRVETLERP